MRLGQFFLFAFLGASDGWGPSNAGCGCVMPKRVVMVGCFCGLVSLGGDAV